MLPDNIFLQYQRSN